MSADDIKVERAVLRAPSGLPVRVMARQSTADQLAAIRQARRIAKNQEKRANDPIYRKAVAWARLRLQLGNEKSQAGKLGISEGRLRRMIAQAKRWGEL